MITKNWIEIEKIWKQVRDQKQVREWKQAKDGAQGLLYFKIEKLLSSSLFTFVPTQWAACLVMMLLKPSNMEHQCMV